MRTKRTFIFVLAALCVLFIPLFAMQFQVAGWDWSPSDFVVAGALLAALGFGLAAASNKNFPRSHRVIGVCFVVLVLVLYVHLAVGIVDTWPLAGS